MYETHELNEKEEDWVNDDRFAELGFVKIESFQASIHKEASIDSDVNQMYNETTGQSEFLPCYMVDYLMYTIDPVDTNNV